MLSRSQLLDRLAAPKTRTDRFDHPLLFARSGMTWPEAERYQYPEQIGIETPHWASDSDRDMVENLSFIQLLQDPVLPTTATMGGILSLTRALLAQTPHLENLSLTGFLERAVCGPRVPAGLTNLRSLTLGPPDYGWSWTPPLYQLVRPSIASVERLRVCGRVLGKEEATAILGGLPRLQHLQWSYARATAGSDGAEASR